MPELLATWLVRLVGAYLLVGLILAPVLVLRALPRIDGVAAAGTWGFRLLVLPGVIALWPQLLKRWRAASGSPPDVRYHGTP